MRLTLRHSGRSAASCPAATWMSLPVATARRGLGDGVLCSPARSLTWASARPLGDSSSPWIGGGKVCGASSFVGAASGCLSALVRSIELIAGPRMQANSNPSRPRWLRKRHAVGWQILARPAGWRPAGLACRHSRDQPLAPEPGTAAFYGKQASTPPWDDQIGSAARASLQARCISGRGDQRINGARQDRLTYIAGDPGPRH